MFAMTTMTMSALSELEKWYRSQCNGEWEHGEGISIGTLDNPGWSMEVSLRGTALEDASFQERSYGVGKNAEPSGEDWLTCKIVDKKFKGFGGPFKLAEMVGIFLDWAAKNREQSTTPNAAPPAPPHR